MELNALKKRIGTFIREKTMGLPSAIVTKDTMKEQRDRSIMKTKPFKRPAMLATK